MEETNNPTEWQWVHSYQSLARVGIVKDLACPEDGDILIPVMGQDVDLSLILWCPQCDGLITPGAEMMAQIRAVVNEHREDI